MCVSYLCICVYIHVCSCKYTHTHTRTTISISIYMHMYMDIHICICACMYVYTCVYICVHICIHRNRHIYAYLKKKKSYTYIHTCTHTLSNKIRRPRKTKHPQPRTLTSSLAARSALFSTSKAATLASPFTAAVCRGVHPVCRRQGHDGGRQTQGGGLVGGCVYEYTHIMNISVCTHTLI